MRKIIGVILTVTVLTVILLVAPAYAADANSLATKSGMLPQLASIWSMSTELNIDSMGKATRSGVTGPVIPASATYIIPVVHTGYVR